MLVVMIDCGAQKAAVSRQLALSQRIRYDMLYPYVFVWGRRSFQLERTDHITEVPVVWFTVCKNGDDLTTSDLVPLAEALGPKLNECSIGLDMNGPELSVQDCVDGLVLVHDAIRLFKFHSTCQLRRGVRSCV